MSKIFIPPGYSLLVRLLDFDESANVEVKAWTELGGKFQPAQGGLVAAGQSPRNADIIIPLGGTMLHFVSIETSASEDSGDANQCQIGLVQNSRPNAEFDILLSAGRLIPEKLMTWPDSWACPCGNVQVDVQTNEGVPTLANMIHAGPLVTWSPPTGKLARLQYSRIGFITGVQAGQRQIMLTVAEIGNNPYFAWNKFTFLGSQTYQLQGSTQGYEDNEGFFNIIQYKLMDIIIDETMEVIWEDSSAIGTDAFVDDGEVYYLEFDA